MKINSRRKFLEQSALASLGFLALPYLKNFDFSFEYATPESVGVDAAALANFVKAADASGLEWHSFVIQRKGKIISEGYWSPFKADLKHTLYSLSKSFTSTAVGLAVAEGRFAVEDHVIKYFPNDLPETVSPYLKELKIKHLLTMNVGHEKEVNWRDHADKTWVQAFLAHPIVNKPGTQFLYNTPATYMLGAIIYQTTGKTLEEYLKPRLFDKLGITDFDWEKSPQGLNTAGYGLRISTRDIAKFGLMYQQKGMWDGQPILTESWVGQATRKQVPSQEGDGDWSQGYGYQFWRCKPEPGFYRGDGAYGQYCIVIPQYEMVIAVNSESADMGKSMQIIWDHILPGIKDAPLPENKMANEQLKMLSNNLEIPVTKGMLKSKNAKKLYKKTLTFAENDFGLKSINIKVKKGLGTIEMQTEKGGSTLDFGMEKWVENGDKTTNFFPVPNRIHVPSKIAATATWIDETTFQINRKFYEAMHGDALIFKIKEDGVELSFNNSVAIMTKGSDPRPTLTGKWS